MLAGLAMSTPFVVISYSYENEKFLLLELRGVLADDARSQHVGHMQNLLMHFVIGGNICSPIALKPRHNFLSRQVQVVAHHLAHFCLRPTLRICLAKEICDLICIGEPALGSIILLRFISRLGCGHNFGGAPPCSTSNLV